MLPFLTSGLGPELRELIHNPMSRGLHDSEFVFLNRVRVRRPAGWLATMLRIFHNAERPQLMRLSRLKEMNECDVEC